MSRDGRTGEDRGEPKLAGAPPVDTGKARASLSSRQNVPPQAPLPSSTAPAAPQGARERDRDIPVPLVLPLPRRGVVLVPFLPIGDDRLLSVDGELVHLAEREVLPC